MGEKQTKGLHLASGGQELTCCAGCMLDCVQVLAMDKKLTLLWLRRKMFVLKDQPDHNWDIFPASKGLIILFSASVVMEMPYRLCAVVLGRHLLFILDCRSCLCCGQVKRSRTKDHVTGQLEGLLYL